MRGISSSHGHTRGGKHIDAKVTCFFRRVLSRLHSLALAQTARTVQEGDNGYQIDEDGEEEYDQNDAYYEDEVAEEEIEDQFPERGRWGGDSFMNSRRTPAWAGGNAVVSMQR